MFRFTASIVTTAVLLAGCTSAPVGRYVSPLGDVGARQSIAYRAVEVREVALPGYAAAEEIAVQASDGVVQSKDTDLWADSPTRAVTLQLSQALAQITRANVAAEPWPFESFPQARVEVRISDLLARSDGTYVASGQYFVANGLGRADRTRSFDLSVGYDPEAGPTAIAAARSALIVMLAKQIARDGLR